MKKALLYSFNFIALVLFAVLLVYGQRDKKIMTQFFTHVSYYLVLLIFLIWIAQAALLLKHLKFSIGDFCKKYWIGILAAIIMTVVVFVSVQIGFKTLSDETNYLAVANSMLNDKTCFNSTMGKYYYGNFNPFNRELLAHPLMFPFMVQMVHVFTGFRYENVFVFNFIVMLCLLTGVYVIVRRFLDVRSSIAAVLLILSYPVTTIFATSGGFDFFNAAFFILLMAGVYYFIKEPSSVAFSFLFASLLMFANIRNESMFFLPFIPLLLLIFRKLKWQHLKESSHLLFVTPLVSLPYFWKCMLAHYPYLNKPTEAAFSLELLLKNSMKFLGSLVDFKRDLPLPDTITGGGIVLLPYANIVSIISLLIFVYLAIYLAVNIYSDKTGLSKQGWSFLIVLILSFLASCGLFLVYYWGDYTHPASARLFIILSIFLAFGPVALRIFRPNLISGTTLLVFSIIAFLFYHPKAVEHRFINSLMGIRITNHCIDFLSTLHDKKVMVVSDRPGQFTALGYGAIDFNYANKYTADVLTEVNRHLYSKVVVFQEIEYDGKKPTQGTILVPGYNLKSLLEIQISPVTFLRISEIIIPEG